MKTFISIVLALILFGCARHGKWEIITSNTPELGVQTDAIFFQSPDSGLFCGYVLKEDSSSQKFGNLELFPHLVLTTSGGKEWTEIPSPKNAKGNVYEAYLQDSIIVCIIDTTIFKTYDLGRTWNILLSGDIRPFNVDIRNENLIYVIRDSIYKKEKYLLKYENGKINTLKKLDTKYDYTFSNGKLFYYLTNNEYKTNEIIEEDIQSAQTQSYKFDNLYTVQYLSNLKTNLTVLVSENNILLINKDKTNVLAPTFLKTYYVTEFLCSNNVLICICKNREHNTEVMTDIYYISKDYGITWQQLQKEFGSNRKKFLLDGKFLFSYEIPYGMQKLEL